VLELFEYGFMQRALVAGVVMALVCPVMGVFLIPRRLSLIADTLAHVALAGVALGLFLGVSPFVGATGVTLLGAVLIERLRARGGLRGDAALAIFLSGGFALAVVLIGLARGFNADLFAVLFGSILTVSWADVWLILALGAVVGLAVGVSYRQLFAITFHEELAYTSGVRVGALNLMLTMLTALTTVVAMRMVGVLLVSAMIVIPTLTGFTLARSFRQATVLAVGSALVAVGTGLVAAYYLRLAAGGTIVLAALLILGAAAAGRRLVSALRRRARSGDHRGSAPNRPSTLPI
jgi:zinc transport system permease protein